MAMASGPGASMPTSTRVVLRPRPTFSSSRRATASDAPFLPRLPSASSVAFSVNRLRFGGAGVRHDAAQPELLVDLAQARAGDARPTRAARCARARAPSAMSAGERVEAERRHLVGHVRDRHAEAQVRLVRAVALHAPPRSSGAGTAARPRRRSARSSALVERLDQVERSTPRAGTTSRCRPA